MLPKVMSHVRKTLTFFWYLAVVVFTIVVLFPE